MKKLFFISLLFFAFIACKKNQLGGKSSVKGTTVYIKFDSKESAGSDVSKYDSKVKADINGNYEIPALYKGDYYLYAVGEDFAVPPPYTVFGGVPLTLRNNENISINIPVTEGD
jgi:hypothetical protein